MRLVDQMADGRCELDERRESDERRAVYGLPETLSTDTVKESSCNSSPRRP